MNYTQLKSFHALALTGGFSRAAEILHVTQPAVSRQLKALETDYGLELFHRDGHKLILTDVGKQLLEVCTHLFGLIDEAQEILTSASQLMSGDLRLAADSPFFIMDVLACFKKAYPNVSVSVEMGSASQCLTWIRENEVDVAVLTALDIPPELYAETFMKLELILLVRTDHEWARRRSVNLEELIEVPMIMRETTSVTRQVLERSMQKYHIAPTIELELHNQLAIREAVAAGLGLGVELDGGLRLDSRLCMLRIKGCSVFGQEYVACHRNRRPLRKVEAFMELAKEAAPTLVRAGRSHLKHNQKS